MCVRASARAVNVTARAGQVLVLRFTTQGEHLGSPSWDPLTDEIAASGLPDYGALREMLRHFLIDLANTCTLLDETDRNVVGCLS
jgi:hypothetical protein